MAASSHNRFAGSNGDPRRGKHPTSDDADEIRHRMEAVRRDLGVDVAKLSHEAKQATQWQYYVKKFPLTCAGVALLVGYSLVPARKRVVAPSAEQLRQLAESGKLHVVSDPPPAKRAGVLQKGALALGTVVARAAMAYVGKQIGDRVPASNGGVRQ